MAVRLQVHRMPTPSRTPHYHHIPRRRQRRHKMAANPTEYQKETLRLALELEREYQLKLQELEKEARSKPAMKAMYCILWRQLSDEEENAGYLHQALEAQRKKDVEAEVEGIDEEDAPDSAPSAPPPPPIIAPAPQTEQKAPPRLLLHLSLLLLLALLLPLCPLLRPPPLPLRSRPCPASRRGPTPVAASTTGNVGSVRPGTGPSSCAATAETKTGAHAPGSATSPTSA